LNTDHLDELIARRTEAIKVLDDAAQAPGGLQEHDKRVLEEIDEIDEELANPDLDEYEILELEGARNLKLDLLSMTGVEQLSEEIEIERRRLGITP
jgi:hypothetical protein